MAFAGPATRMHLMLRIGNELGVQGLRPLRLHRPRRSSRQHRLGLLSHFELFAADISITERDKTSGVPRRAAPHSACVDLSDPQSSAPAETSSIL